MAKIIDPDSLAQTTDVVLATGAKTVQIVTTGAVSNSSPGSTSGVTLQCIYSFLKEEWKTDAALNKFKFPIKMFTKTDGTFINGWTFADATSRNVIRDAGWIEGSNSYAGIISLGNFNASTDQAYYQRVTGYDQAITNFNKTGNLNEAILITGATGYLKNYLRIQGKLYAEYNLPTEQSITTLEAVLYKLPLANSTDLKTTATDITIDTTTPFVGTATATNTDGSVSVSSPTFTSAAAPFVSGDVGKLITIAAGTNAGQYKIVTFTSASVVDVDRNFEATEATITYNLRPKGMKLNYLKGIGFTTYANSTVYPAASVVFDSTSRWFFTAAGGTSNGATRATDIGVTDWVAYDGERQMGTNYYAFNRIVTANGGTDRQVYDWMARQLRVTGVGKTGGVLDVNQNDSTTAAQKLGIAIRGNIAELLGEYVGDTLKTIGGLSIASFDSNSTNSLVFRDITKDGGGVSATTRLPLTTTERTFPFVAAGTLNFSANLVSEIDADTKYTMYFTTNPGGNFDTSSAIIVDNNAGVDIAGQITGATINFDFDYTNNVQGGRTADTNADITIVAQGLPGATWTSATHTITKTTGQSITITADDERNYSNP